MSKQINIYNVQCIIIIIIIIIIHFQSTITVYTGFFKNSF